MLESRLLSRIKQKKEALDARRPLPSGIVRRLNEQLAAEWIYHSNAIEGNTLTLRETKLILETGLTIGGKTLREHFEVINHQKAIDYVESLLADEMPLTPFHVRQIHHLVLAAIDDENAGQYRQVSVRIAGATHTPPDAWEVMRLMNEWGDWLNGDALALHPVTRAALAHHQLAAIHPFIDGNGRTARLVMNVLLMREGYPPTIIMKSNRRQYYRVLSQADGGNHKPLVNFVGRAVERGLTFYLEACTPQTQAPPADEIWILLRQAADGTPYSQPYLSLLARKGRLEAVKRGRNWYT
ncbi:MAG: Fic family protein, partial [Ardenticatenaceae bacterium]